MHKNIRLLGIIILGVGFVFQASAQSVPSSGSIRGTYTPPISGTYSPMPAGGCPSSQYWNGTVCTAGTCPNGGTYPNCTPMTGMTTGGSGSYVFCPSGQYNNGSVCTDMTEQMCANGNMGSSVPRWKWEGGKCKEIIASASRTSLLGNALETLRSWFSRP